MRGARDWAQRARDLTYYLGLLPAGRRHWRHLPRFLREARAYRDAVPRDGSFAFSWDAVQPMLSDYAEAAGTAGGHYFHQDLWAARRIHPRAPRQHVDIGSRVDGFVSHVLAFMHIGLGRYGDPILAEGWRAALIECVRVLAPGGRFYLGTPVGRERLNFNSGRVFAPQTIIDAVADLRLASFAAVDDNGRFVDPADPGALSAAEYGCGLFEFIKP